MSRSDITGDRPALVFAALGSETRLVLVARLSDGQERSIAALTEGLDLTRQATTKHLQVLQNAGVVDCRRVGRETRFTIRSEALKTAKAYLMRVSDQWDNAIDRLRAKLE